MNRYSKAFQYVFAKLYPFQEEQYRVASEAGLNTGFIAFNSKAVVSWFNIIGQAELQDRLINLINFIDSEYPDIPEIIAFKHQTNTFEGPPISTETRDNRKSINSFEKITGKQSTLLQIAFLEIGLDKSRSVCRILIKTEDGIIAGTGFLINNNYLVTNNHVINSSDILKEVTIQFNYQKTATGAEMLPVEFKLDLNYFQTNVEYDFTIVKVTGNPNETFKYLELKRLSVKENDFVNIIQHPGGEYKQIGLYHNLVSSSDNKYIHYYTDTRPGSSGSPVFNSDWEVVALHHSGDFIKNPNENGPYAINEGININHIIDALP